MAIIIVTIRIPNIQKPDDFLAGTYENLTFWNPVFGTGQILALALMFKKWLVDHLKLD